VAYREGLEIVLKKDRRIERVKEILRGLKRRGKRLMVLTNDRTDGTRSVFSWTGLDKFFEKIVISETLGMEKPDPRVFRYMVKIAGVEKEDIVYVGDDPERDIKPSKELGIRTVLLKNPESLSVSKWRNYGFRLKAGEKPDFVVRDLVEILDLIR